jgi:DNA primase
MNLSRVDVVDFLTALQVEVAGRSGHNILFRCPFHLDRHPSARMHKDTTQWLCSSGCGKGNAIHFLSMLREMSYADAEAHIANRYGIGPAMTIDGDLEAEVKRNILGVVEQEPVRVVPDVAWIDRFACAWEAPGRAHDYLVEQRGFDPGVLDDFEVGYDERTDRITIPVRDVDDTLVGFKARAVDPDKHPRYLILGTSLGCDGAYPFNTYRKSEFVYGLNLVPFGSRVVLCEGELNVIACAQKVPQIQVVAVAGSEFSETQRRLIVERCSGAVVLFDDDDAGRRGAGKVIAALMQSGIDVRVGLMERDAAEATAGEIMEAVIGADPVLLAITRGDLPVLATT